MKPAKKNIIDEVFAKNDAFLLAILGSEARRKFTEAIEGFGLSWAGQRVIASLHIIATEHEAVSQAQLADFIGIDPRNLVSIIDTLEQLAMLQRVANPTDRRRYHLRLTTKGEEMAKQVQEVRAKIGNEILAYLSVEERKILHRLLRKLWDHNDISHGFRVLSQPVQAERKNKNAN